MKPSKTILASCVLFVFILMYTTSSKLINFPNYHRSMLSQQVPHWLAEILTYIIPAAETAVIGLLLFPRTLRTGFWAMGALMFVFTGYTAWIKLSGLHEHTCPCGGLFSRLNWNQHLLVNTLLMLLAFASAIFYNKRINVFQGHEKRRSADAFDPSK